MSTQINLSWKRLITNTFVIYRYSNGMKGFNLNDYPHGIYVAHIDKVENNQLVLTDKISYISGHPALAEIELSFEEVTETENIWRNVAEDVTFELLGVFSNIFEAERYVYDNLPEELI